jgi:hypothetical protein
MCCLHRSANNAENRRECLPVVFEAIFIKIADGERKAMVDPEQRGSILCQALNQPFGDAAPRPALVWEWRRRAELAGARGEGKLRRLRLSQVQRAQAPPIDGGHRPGHRRKPSSGQG